MSSSPHRSACLGVPDTRQIFFSDFFLNHLFCYLGYMFFHPSYITNPICIYSFLYYIYIVLRLEDQGVTLNDDLMITMKQIYVSDVVCDINDNTIYGPGGFHHFFCC